MPADEQLLYGKIALSQGFCTQAQVDECIQMQTLGEADAPVGELLLFKGFITSAQHAEILKMQKRILETPAPVPAVNKEGALFGKLVLREKWLSEDKVNECLREQGQPGEKRTLGEIMVSKGFLTAAQVKQLLGLQQKRLMSCPTCRLSYTVRSLQSSQVNCPRCKGPLREGKPTESTRTDAEFATQVLRIQNPEATASGAQDSRPAPSATRRVSAICVVCDAVFQGAIDSTGRLRCPSCNSTFTPR